MRNSGDATRGGITPRYSEEPGRRFGECRLSRTLAECSHLVRKAASVESENAMPSDVLARASMLSCGGKFLGAGVG